MLLTILGIIVWGCSIPILVGIIIHTNKHGVSEMKTPDNPQNCDVVPGIVTKTFNIPTFIDAIPLIKPHVYVQYEYNGVSRTVLLCEWDARYLIDAYMDYRTFSFTGIMDLKSQLPTT